MAADKELPAVDASRDPTTVLDVVLMGRSLGGAVVASLLIHGATALFILYLDSGLAKYNLVYGSLGALLALMTWTYITSLLILFGAHVGASIAEESERRGWR